MSYKMRVVGSGFPYSYEAIGYGPGAASINSLKLEATYATRVLCQGVPDLGFLRSAPGLQCCQSFEFEKRHNFAKSRQKTRHQKI